MLRILIADEHEIVRHGLRIHLQDNTNWEIVGEAADGRRAISEAIRTSPDVAVLAYELLSPNGIEVTREIRTRSAKTEVLIYTAFNIDNVLRQLLEVGARGCVLKSEPMETLTEAIRTVASRKPFFAGIAASPEVLKKRSGSGDLLTNRERTVVQMIADGHSNKEVASTLGISLKTVETHRASVMTKLGLHSSAGLVRYAVRSGLTLA